jgi:hypothetical protein
VVVNCRKAGAARVRLSRLLQHAWRQQQQLLLKQWLAAKQLQEG